MNKKHLVIISCVLLIGLVAGVWQYIQTFKTDVASAVTVGTPNPGHAWASMECSANTICLDTSGNKVGIGTNTPSGKLQVCATSSCNAGDTLQIGNDVYINDIDSANTFGLKGAQTAAEGGIRFGSSSTALIYGKGGTIGINTNNPDTGVRLDVYGQLKVCDAGGECGILQVECYPASNACYIKYDPN